MRLDNRMKIIKELKNGSICKLCGKFVLYREYCWENHFFNFHPEVSWRQEDSDYLENMFVYRIDFRELWKELGIKLEEGEK